MVNEHFLTLDETVRAIKAECETQLKAMSDKLLAAEIEAAMAKDQLEKALLAKEDAIQVTSRLIERMALAEEAFAGARKFALAFNTDERLPPKPAFTEQSN